MPTMLAGLIGYPLSHSISPPMHRAAFAYYGLDADYLLWELKPQAVPDRVTALRDPTYYGSNVTVPYKEVVVPCLDELESGAETIGAVNTIVNRKGVLAGFNTDAPGFLRALDDTGLDISDGGAIILGAGGAARAVAYALATRSPTDIVIVNRHKERAYPIAAMVGKLGVQADVLDYNELRRSSKLQNANLLVNATSCGLQPAESPLPTEWVPEQVLVYDLIYRPTALLKSAHARGIRAIDGLSMLVYQGGLSFELWTGLPAPIPTMMSAARKALGQE